MGLENSLHEKKKEPFLDSRSTQVEVLPINPLDDFSQHIRNLPSRNHESFGTDGEVKGKFSVWKPTVLSVDKHKRYWLVACDDFRLCTLHWENRPIQDIGKPHTKTPFLGYDNHVRKDTLAGLLGHLNEVESKQAPPSIYLDGHQEILYHTPKISVVGTRKPSELGAKRARKLAWDIAEGGGVVVSGLAQGVDTLAHYAAIEAGGKTIAVLGTGLDIAFPSENAKLLEIIRRDHLAISQFAPGTPAMRGNFPQRNRTMALLSDATVIVEAGKTSGTKHQGWEALRLGRPLFILQSLADSGLDWVKEMLEYGARPLTDCSDLFEVLPAVTDARNVLETPF